MASAVFSASTPLSVSFDRYSLKINGQRQLIRSGAMHYFRLPSPATWRDRLQKLKAAGYNTVDLYFNWGFHSPAPGQYDFTGCRDVQALLELTQELGLYVIARPGPYINAEVSGGGFPGWLLAQAGPEPEQLTLRHREVDGTFHWCERYMKAVEEWYAQILPFIAAAPNVLFMQIENEYATEDLEPDYLQALAELARKHGVQVPLSHNDLYTFGCYADLVDLYGFDHYPTTHFDVDWRDHAASMLSTIDQVDAHIRPFCPNRPLYVAEFQAGWFAPWKGPTAERIRELMGRDHLKLITKSLLAQGVTMFNHYMAIGGTNWAGLGSTDTYTSYNFDAPIHETGHLQPHYYEAKAINTLLGAFDLSATDAVEEHGWQVHGATTEGEGGDRQDCLIAVRSLVDKPETQWLFLRNLDAEPLTLQVSHPNHCPEGFHRTLAPFDCVMLPVNLTLETGFKVLWSSVEPFYQAGSLLAVKAHEAGQIALQAPNGETLTLELAACASWDIGQWQGLTVAALGQQAQDEAWAQPDGRLLLGATVCLSPTYDASGPKPGPLTVQTKTPEQLKALAPDGQTLALQPEALPQPSLPSVEWDIHPLAWPVQEALWTSVQEQLSLATKGRSSEMPPNLDQLGLYEGLIVYRYQWPAGTEAPKELLVQARHLWKAWLNGQMLHDADSWTALPLVQPTQPHSIHLSTPSGTVSPPVWKEQEANELFLLVDSLGHPKGFNSDAHISGGLLRLEADGMSLVDERLQFQHLNEALWEALSQASAQPRAQASLALDGWLATGVFNYSLQAEPSSAFEASMGALAETTTPHAPLVLQVSSDLADRLIMSINGVRFGQSWQPCGAQQQFYLPEGLLKPGPNTLHILAWNLDDPNLPLPTAEALTLKWAPSFSSNTAQAEEREPLPTFTV